MAKRVLITGAAGFFGRHMRRYLADIGQNVIVIGTDTVNPGVENYDSFYKLNLSGGRGVEDLIKKTTPDYILHFAGTFGTSDCQEIYKVNVLSIVGLLEAICRHAPQAITVVAGSAAEYGHIEPNQLPIDEQTPCKPITPYGMSKLLATQIAQYYYYAHNIRTIIARPFQLIGKEVTSKLAPGAFAQQLKRTLAEKSKIIKVGNLGSSRDFLDIDDAVQAVWALCKKPAPGQIFNLCSGKPTGLADLLDMMITHCGANVRVEVDQARLRGCADANIVYGSYEKLRRHCGWQPHVSLKNSIAAMFDSKKTTCSDIQSKHSGH
ncbi:MAG: NAD-dependent epimerase/dehydratase family protein [Planctomycetota bacterium]|jgi:GDP-4-dehydro-6-deoxy-D-mannose reductase